MILLDTHVLLWGLHGRERLGPVSSSVLGSVAPVNYSAVSVLEMTVKSLKGRLRVPAGICESLDDAGLRQLPFVGEHAEAMAELPELAGSDPFDWALLAQAKAEGMRFLTADRRLLALGLTWILDARR